MDESSTGYTECMSHEVMSSVSFQTTKSYDAYKMLFFNRDHIFGRDILCQSRTLTSFELAWTS